MSEEKSVRERTYEFVQSTHVDDEDLENAVLVGFLLVAEWQAPDERRWLSKVSGDSSRPLPPWRERMMGFEVAHEWWDDEREEEDAGQEE